MNTRFAAWSTLFSGSLFLFATAGAQTGVSTSPTFADRTPLELRITGPFQQLTRDEERIEHDAVIEYTGPSGQDVSVDIEVRIRGRSRLENCDFPPLSLDFPRDGVAETVFAGQDRLKLVTLCQRGGIFRDYLAQEYLIYQLLNQLTDHSFRVRWANVEYVYTDTKKPRTKTEPAFLIEADSEVAERLGMEVLELEHIDIDALDPEHTALLSMFQYLIGNTDWAVLDGPPGEFCCHNGKVIGNSGEPLIVLPYDFDNAGLIAPKYAVPAEHLPISSVRRRLYRGFCELNSEVEEVIARLNSERDLVMSIMDDEMISESTRRRASKYLDAFFEIVNDPEELEDEIYDSRRCR